MECKMEKSKQNHVKVEKKTKQNQSKCNPFDFKANLFCSKKKTMKEKKQPEHSSNTEHSF